MTDELDDITRKILIKTQEECGEIVQIISKILLFGLDSWHPDDPTKSNAQLLQQELGDVLAMIDLIVASGIGTTHDGLSLAKGSKFIKLARYHRDIVQCITKIKN